MDDASYPILEFDPAPAITTGTIVSRVSISSSKKVNLKRVPLSVAWLLILALTLFAPCLATEHGKWGYLHQDGTFAIKPRFDFAQSFLFQNAYVLVGTEYWLIDEKGGMVANASKSEKNFKPVSPDVDHGVHAVRSGGKWTIYDAGQHLTTRKPQFDRAENGLLSACDEGKYGYIDKDFKFVIKPQFDEAGEFNEGLAEVRVGNRFGYIGQDGCFKISPTFLYARGFHDGLAAVQVVPEAPAK